MEELVFTMSRKVYYVVKSNLHYYPPCVSQIRILKDLGVDVTVLYGSSNGEILNILSNEGIECVELKDPRNRFKGKLDKINNWLQFRWALKDYLKKIDLKDTVFWFGTAETLLLMRGALKNINYVASFLELLDHSPKRIKMLAPMAKNALAVTTCEETRSYLMQYWFKLDKLPYTIPNKPYSVQYKKGEKPTIEAGKRILDKTKGHKFVIYQGIFQNPEYMKAIAQVMRDHYPDMYLVMMGMDTYNIVDKVKSIHEKTIVSDYIPAPLHLQVTANAYIGILFYKPDSLNKAFCAPNKIFEYSNFGLPIIGNDIPGLKNTIGAAKAGCCINFSYDSVLEAFKYIESHYEEMSKAAVDFYEGVDNVSNMKQIAVETKMI